MGVFKHGYGRYDAIRDDTTLCFHQKIEDMKGLTDATEMQIAPIGMGEGVGDLLVPREFCIIGKEEGRGAIDAEIDGMADSLPATCITAAGDIVDQSTIQFGDSDVVDGKGNDTEEREDEKEDDKEEEKEEDPHDDDEEEEGGEEKLTLRLTLGKRLSLSSSPSAGTGAAVGSAQPLGDKYTAYTMPDPRTLNR